MFAPVPSVLPLAPLNILDHRPKSGLLARCALRPAARSARPSTARHARSTGRADPRLNRGGLERSIRRGWRSRARSSRTPERRWSCPDIVNGLDGAERGRSRLFRASRGSGASGIVGRHAERLPASPAGSSRSRTKPVRRHLLGLTAVPSAWPSAPPDLDGPTRSSPYQPLQANPLSVPQQQYLPSCNTPVAISWSRWARPARFPRDSSWYWWVVLHCGRRWMMVDEFEEEASS